MRTSSAAWLAVGVGVVAVIVVLRMLKGRGISKGLDAGSVSSQWIAEHRAEQSDGSGS